MVAVACSADSKFPRIINCVSQVSTSWRVLFDWLECEKVPFDDWRESLKKVLESSESITSSVAGRAHPLLSLQHRFVSSFPYLGDLYANGRISNQNLITAMSAAPRPISKEVFIRFINLMKPFLN